MALAAEIAAAIDAGEGLDDGLYRELLDSLSAAAAGQQPAAGQPWLHDAVNDGSGDTPRLVLLEQGSVLAPAMMEQYLVLAGRRSVCAVLPENLQPQKKRRAGTNLPEGVEYDGNGFGGRVNMLPSERTAPPRIGKRSTTWRRLLHGQATHEVTGYEVRRVVPHPAPAAALVSRDMSFQGATTLYTTAAHPFSGAKQVAHVAGLGQSLDGYYAVTAAQPNSAAFKFNLPKQSAAAAAGLQQKAQQGLVTVRETHVLDNSLTLYHFMLTGGQQGAVPQQQQQQPEPQQAVGIALVPPVPANAAPNHHGPGLQLQEALLDDAADLIGQGQNGTHAWWDLYSDHHHQGGTQPGSQQAQNPPAAASSHGQPGAGGSAGVPPAQPGSPAASSGGGGGQQAVPGVAEHVQNEGHYPLLTVGSQQPVANRGQYEGKAFVVLGNAEVTGELRVQGLPVVSDERAKEHIRLFDEAEKAVKIAAEISTYIYQYKGTDAQRLGVVAQQVRQVLERHDALETNIVREGPQGLLSVDLGGVQALLLQALQKALADVADLREAQGSMQLAVLGRMQELQATVKELQAAGSSSSGVLGGAADRPYSSGSSASSSSRLSGPLTEEQQDEASLEMLQDAGDVDMDSGSGSCDEEGEEGEGAGGSEAAAAGDLAGLSDDQVVQLLLDRLQEQPGVAKLFRELVTKLSRVALWETLQDTLTAPPDLTAAGDRQRTPGGQFIKLAKKRAAAEAIRRKAEAEGIEPLVLRGYQQRVAERAKQGGNLILVAPTGSGKTAVAAAHSEHVLQQNALARIVFLAPTVALAQQQTATYLRCPSFRSGAFHVTCRTSDNPVAPRDWITVLQEHHVLVMTPQLLLNMLDAGAAHFRQINLLILDEAHHAKDNHSANKVLAHYRRSERTTQILGLTASPASRSTLDATYADFLQLMRNLDAKYVVLDERDEELLAAVPVVEEQEIVVELAQQDQSLAGRLGSFVVGAIHKISAELELPDLKGLPAEVQAMMLAGKWCTTAVKWTVTAAEGLQAAAESAAANTSIAKVTVHDATSALLLVRAAVAALALVSDVGFEAAVRHLSQEYYSVAAKLVQGAGSSQMPLTASLLQQLALEVELADVLPGAFSAEAGVLSRHPKFQALEQYLLQYHQHSTFHGIVFARTREAVRSLTKLIQASPDLQFLQVYSFMGHGGLSRISGNQPGMTSKQQQAVMDQFKQPGRRLLVSTSAGEEGIDVPRCEFVIRYTATQTGRERVQSAGRARKFGSTFVEIIEASSQELALVRKSRLEAENMRKVLEGLSAGMGSMTI